MLVFAGFAFDHSESTVALGSLTLGYPMFVSLFAGTGLSKRIQRALRALASAGAIAGLVAAPGEARADGPVSPTGKGIVGGALLGAEVVDLTLGIVGVESGWPYFVFGGLGAAGGGVGGYFIEQSAPTEVPLYMLAGGMALVIPTLVVSLNATAYKPPESDSAEPAPPEPAGEPPKATFTITSEAKPAKRRSPQAVATHLRTSMIDLHEGRLALGVPALELRPTYSQRELAMFAEQQRPELRVPLLQASF